MFGVGCVCVYVSASDEYIETNYSLDESRACARICYEFGGCGMSASARELVGIGTSASSAARIRD